MQEVICFESEDGQDPSEMAGRQEGEVANEDGPVRDEEERRVVGPRVLQQNRLEYTLDLAGNAMAPRREARSRGRRGGTKTGRRMAVQGAAEPVGRLAGAIQGDVGADDRGKRQSRGPGEKTS